MSDSWHLQRRIPSHRQDSRSKHGSSFDMWKPYSRWKILLFFQKFLDCHVLILQDVVECRESKQIKNVIDFIIHVGEFDISSNLPDILRSEEHTSELQSRGHLVCRLLLEKKYYSPHPSNANPVLKQDVLNIRAARNRISAMTETKQ